MMFTSPMLNEFDGPPRNTRELHPTLYEDLDGDGDSTDISEVVMLFKELIVNDSLGLSDEQARKLNWNSGSPPDSVTLADMVSLFAEKVRSG